MIILRIEREEKDALYKKVTTVGDRMQDLEEESTYRCWCDQLIERKEKNGITFYLVDRKTNELPAIWINEDNLIKKRQTEFVFIMNKEGKIMEQLTYGFYNSQAKRDEAMARYES